MKTAEHKEWIERRRKAHHWALSTLVDGKIDGLVLWRRLRKIEIVMHKANEMYCNGDFDMEAWEAAKAYAQSAIKRAFHGTIPEGFFINGDPRGCALKLDPDVRPIPEGMERDWGGNGILAAEINDD